MNCPTEGDAVEQARAVATGTISAEELIGAAIGWIEAANPRLNAVVSQRFQAALGEARNPRQGPFAGVPILLKELTPYPDWPSTMASRALRNAAPGEKSPFVQTIERAGFIVLGRTNSAEFGALPITQPDLFGPTRNPWNTAHDCGGSSGGAAAAVASGMVAIATGGDAGGSIRIPASACGLFGFKPSRGRVSPYPAANPEGFATMHAVTASVRDSAAFLDITSGARDGDCWALGAPTDGFAKALERRPPRLRVALAPDGFAAGEPVHRECRDAVESIGASLQAVGYEVATAKPPLDAQRLHTAFLERAAVHATLTLDRLIASPAEADGKDVGRWMRGMAAWGATLPPFALALAAEAFQQTGWLMAEFHDSYDALLTPVLNRAPELIGGFDAIENFDALKQAMLDYSPHALIASATGQPACSIPVATSFNGLPIGVQITTRVGEDALLLQLAAEIEAVRPWPRHAPMI